jgi:hypothetical protein
MKIEFLMNTTFHKRKAAAENGNISTKHALKL